MKLKKGDLVTVVKGKDKGKTEKIEKVFPKEQKVLVLGVNIVKRHLKARSQKQPAEIVSVPKPIAMANVMLVCSKCTLLTRVGYRVDEGKHTRVCKKCEEIL